MDNNRTILAVVLIVLLWSAYSLFFAPQSQIQQPAVIADTEQVNTIEKDEVKANSVTNEIDTDLIVNDVSEEAFVTVSSDFFDIKLSTIGATVRSVVLKQYNETNETSSSSLTLLSADNFELSTLQTFGSDGFYIPKNLNYQLTTNKDLIIVDKDNVEINFVASINNFIVVKTYIFHPDLYSFDVNIKITNTSSSPVSGRFNLSLLSSWDKDSKSAMYTFVGPVTYDGEELQEDKPAKLEESPKLYKNNFVWSGYSTKYFLNAIDPHESSEQLFITTGSGYVENKFISAQSTLLANQEILFDYTSYFGPKDDKYLLAAGHLFDEVIDYGFFHPLSKPLMVVLKFFYKFLGNYGFSIILLTVCIKLIFWPLTQKSYKSMKGMQKLQPEMKKMREKYGSDKQKLNQEMMAFYKENKVNPMGGCLPMVIQIPVFFALYRVLLGSIELRHAPFMLWITDLAAKDPYYVTPLIMGVTMFLQQKMTPTNMDPTQEKIMLMMPIVFTFMFLNFPAGLVLYWLTNNLLTILQQYLIRRQPD
ncbi:protein translocase subunit yidC [Desulfuromusa kysingii]|uniref:Membrane protein insertase YidC n=1 Tax=Desulfuromusa kysingii TaxID=37625 RepID=A0A1H4AKM0_9BACT|nr:membrane protein insertase YidC [Desulfuromusa kysingii]SEA36224.1 protein translocase subunit yidC [Desulfuromusa kysingii]